MNQQHLQLQQIESALLVEMTQATLLLELRLATSAMLEAIQVEEVQLQERLA